MPLLDNVAEIVGVGLDTPADPLESVGSAEAIIAAGRIYYDGGVMDRAPELRVIARTGIGVDNVVIADATARGIAVCNTPDAPTISTAEHAVTLLLAVAKQLRMSEEAVRRGADEAYFARRDGLELYGLALGIVGCGRIGRHVARIGQGLGMVTLGYDPWVAPETLEAAGIQPVPALEELLNTADVVSLHVPHTSDTHHLMDAHRFAQMKTGAILINTARGGLVDEAALLVALESGRLRGAGLDVFDPEPPDCANPLLQRDDVVATPHIASWTTVARDRMWRDAIAQALQVLQGVRPPNLVNPEVWDGGRVQRSTFNVQRDAMD